MDTVERSSVEQALIYDGFISYSHAADDLLAPRLQAGLQRFAKPWWKRRAVRVFRDETSLSANPHLWSSITEALDGSGWFVLLLSPDAAESPWVNQEIEYWTEHKDSSRILPVVTDGDFEWTAGDVSGNSVPDALRAVFTEEPRWVDLRFARGEEQLDLKNPRFSSAVADIASALRGVPKDELESEEVKQHRHTIRTAWTAGGLVAILAIAAVGFGIQSARNAAKAEANAAAEAEARIESGRQAQLALARELAASAVNVLENDPELATLLTLEAMKRTPEGIDQPVEVIHALWEAVHEDRLVSVIDTGAGGAVGIALSADGSLLAASSVNDATLRLYSVPDGAELWSYTEETTDSFGIPFISPDEKMVAVGIWDSAGRITLEQGEPRPPDDLPARLVLLDRREGSVIDTVNYPDCAGAMALGWSPQGSYFAVSHVDPCPRPDAADGGWVEILDGMTLDQVALVDTIEDVVPGGSFDQSENLYVFGAEQRQGLELYSAPEFQLDRIAEDITGMGDVSPDGSLVVTFDPGGGSGLSISDVASGQQNDLLRPSGGFPRAPRRPIFSPDGSKVIMATTGASTFIWDVGTGEQVFGLGGGPGTDAAMSPDGKWLYTGHTDGTAKVWSLDPAGGLESVGDLGSYGWINADAFSIGPELGAAVNFDLSTLDSRMVFFDRTTGELRGEPVAAWSTPAVALADNRFALRTKEGRWVVYDPMTGLHVNLAGCPTDRSGRVCTDNNDPAPEITVVASVDGTELAIGVDDSPFNLVDPVTGSTIAPLAPGLDLDIEAFAGDWLLGFSADDAEHVAIERTTGEELARLSAPTTPRREISETGGTIAILADTLTGLTVVDTDTWETSLVEFDLGNVRGLAISPDETKVALGDENGLHILDLDSGVLAQSIPLPSVSDIHWFDSDTVLVGGTDGIWARIPVRTSDLISIAKDNVTRGFSSQECATYRIDPCPTLDEIRGR